MVHEAGGDRVQILDVENDQGAAGLRARQALRRRRRVGRGRQRQPQHALLDPRLRAGGRGPRRRARRARARGPRRAWVTVPGGFARGLRLELMREHLDARRRRRPARPRRAPRAPCATRAAALDAWHADGRARCRAHPAASVATPPGTSRSTRPGGSAGSRAPRTAGCWIPTAARWRRACAASTEPDLPSRIPAPPHRGDPVSVLSALVDAIRSGAVEVVDLTTPLQESTPILRAARAVREHLAVPARGAQPLRRPRPGLVLERHPHRRAHRHPPRRPGRTGSPAGTASTSRRRRSSSWSAPVVVIDMTAEVARRPRLPARGRPPRGVGGRARPAARRRLAALPHRVGGPRRRRRTTFLNADENGPHTPGVVRRVRAVARRRSRR